MYIIGGAQLKFQYNLLDFFFFFCRGPGPPKGQRGSTPGGNSSGVSRALVKDRLILRLIFIGFFQVIFVTNVVLVGFLRFKTFNMQFEELHQKQSQWTVPDTELRESLRLAVAEVLLPAYRSFVKRFGCVFSYLK